jgi:molybdenum cofactor guanylyltransferase
MRIAAEIMPRIYDRNFAEGNLFKSMLPYEGVTRAHPLPHFSAVLLAGGRSRRMGRDKAALVIRGKALWVHQLETLRATGPAELFVSGPAGGPYTGCEVVVDEFPGLGPLAGLSATLRKAGTEWLLVLAVDLPRMTAEFLTQLLQEAEETRCGVVPEDGGRFHALAAVYPRSCLGLIEDRLHTEDRAVQSFVRIGLERGMLRARPLTVEEARLFENLNTPADLERLERAGT